ncbi:MAG: DUF4398 domain-containing protein [Steroidobacteraceae bacterium]|jgi:hypothetical protein|nr:DUF4398 domain-containing protein [Steroidobacteraceae bacterium]
MRAPVIAALLSLLAACGGAPVQQMSDARQAVRAAQAAGAGEYAPEQLAQAQRLIEEAQDGLRRHDYRSAESAAVEARRTALQALEVSRSARAAPPPDRT